MPLAWRPLRGFADAQHNIPNTTCSQNPAGNDAVFSQAPANWGGKHILYFRNFVHVCEEVKYYKVAFYLVLQTQFQFQRELIHACPFVPGLPSPGGRTDLGGGAAPNFEYTVFHFKEGNNQHGLGTCSDPDIT